MTGRGKRRASLGRLSRGEAVAAGSAAVLVVATFLHWYGYEQGGGLLVLVNLFGYPADAWHSLDTTPWLLVLVALVALGSAGLRLTGSGWTPAIPLSAVVAVLGGVSTLLVLYRVLAPPDIANVPNVPIHTTVEYGAYVALAATAGIAYGGYRAMGERGTSFATIADALSKPGRAKPRRRPEPARRSPAKRPSRRRSRSSSD